MEANMYLKFEEPAIEGTSTAPGHAKEIEVLSWSHGFTQPTSPTRSSAGGGSAAQANHSSLSFTKYIDAASNELLKYCWGGQQIGKATLTCLRSSGAAGDKPVEYLRVALQHVIISDYRVSGGVGDVPTENVSLDYRTVQYTFTGPSHSDGSPGANTTATHNLETGKIA